MEKPNLLWIQTDEQRPDSLGCYGSTWARTPYIDALARRGIVYRNCVCNSPVCVPSRASQLTGRYPQELLTLQNNVYALEDVFPPGTIAFPEIFQKVGYATASIGKWHTPIHPTWQQNQPLINLDQYAGYYALNKAYDEDEYRVIKRPGGMPIILAGTYPGGAHHPSQVITDQAIEWLRKRPRGRPFLLRVSHNWPHTPVLAPPPFDKLYDPDEIPIRAYDEEVYQDRAYYDRRRADLHRMADLSPAEVDQMWADYMGLVACVDHQVGRLLSELRHLGLEENTVILYSADHGKALGEWGATEKGFYDSEVWRVPYILSGPGVTPRPRVDTGLCELVDTGRTLLNLAGLIAPPDYRGRDLLSAPPPSAVFGQIGWPDPKAPIFDRAWTEQKSEVQTTARDLPPRKPNHSRMRAAVRTDRYRMDVTWYEDGERVPLSQADGNLFDLQVDPYETNNLWTLPEAQPLVHELWLKLESWFVGLDRPAGLFKDDAGTRPHADVWDSLGDGPRRWDTKPPVLRVDPRDKD